VISMTGCNSTKYNESIEQGNKYLASKEYTKAEESFRLALTEKEDKDVSKLTEQIENIIEIQGFIKNKEYDKALSLCNQVDKNGYINEIIKKDITKFKDDIQKAIASNKDIDKDKEVKEVSTSNSSNDNTKEKDNNTSNEKTNNSTQDNYDSVDMARASLYKGLEDTYTQEDIKLVNLPVSELGDIVSQEIKEYYYVFKVLDRNDGTEWDFYYIYDKRNGCAYQMDMYGNVSN
ncbi:hypothetical protein, partial [Burkholderia pseudomallei]